MRKLSNLLLCLACFTTACTSYQLPVLQQSPTPTSDSRIGQTVSPASPEKTPTADLYKQVRFKMVADTIQARGISNPDVIRAMQTVQRHLFVPSDLIDQAYEDHPLPIGHGQTISQPYIVAWMTESLELKAGERVLEIGTGSGYQAAVLAELGGLEVCSIEIVPELAESAAVRLKTLGYSQVNVKQGDGYYGWPEYAPYDAIIVTAAPDHLPAPLVAQLKENGRLVIPIGPVGGYQDLWKFVNEPGALKAFNLGGVRFVPLVGGKAGEPETVTP